VRADKLGQHCLFGSGRWVAVSPFFCPRGHVRTWGGRLGRPAGDALITLIHDPTRSRHLPHRLHPLCLFSLEVELLLFVLFRVHSVVSEHETGQLAREDLCCPFSLSFV
jgi:hypothetical protein